MPEIRIDKTRCQGHARCYAVAPDLFEIDEDGFSALTVLTIEEDQRGVARRGVDACPERAIEIVN